MFALITVQVKLPDRLPLGELEGGREIVVA